MLAQPTLRRWLGAAVILPALVAGCSRSTDEDSGPQATVPRATTSTTISVAEVPERIDVAYAQAVINALDQVTGDAVRVFVQNGGPSPEVLHRLKSAWSDEGAEVMESGFEREAVKNLEGLEKPPGNPWTVVHTVVDSSPNCLVAGVERNFDEIYVEPSSEDSLDGFVQLLHKQPARDPDKYNPTQWIIAMDAASVDVEVPANPCK